jgi:hypothetical protein
MYCPQCLVEYREGFTECSDCHVPLAAGPPPEPNAGFDPSLDLVIVLETDDPVQAALAKDLLEDAEIPFFVLGDIATLVNSVDGFLHKWVRIQVPHDREAEARELLEQMPQPVADAESTGESGAE